MRAMAAHEQHPQPADAHRTDTTTHGNEAAHRCGSAHTTGSAHTDNSESSADTIHATGSAHATGSGSSNGSAHDTSAANFTSPTHATGNNDRAQLPEWREALAAAQAIPSFARPSSKELNTLTRACEHPRQLRLLLEAFARHADTLPNNSSHVPPASQPNPLPAGTTPSQLPYALLCDFVDDSAHDLREWINALTVFDDWLRENNRPPQPLTMLLPYLSCSAEAQTSSPMPLPLPHILADMLELYGYEGSSGS